MPYLEYGTMLNALQNKTFTQMMQDLQTQNTNISSYVSEITSIIQNGKIPDAPSIPYTSKPIGPIPFLKEKGLETTADVASDDTQQLLFQQNGMYIMGTITCATLIISAIFFARDR
jgi:hypothetical protein